MADAISAGPALRRLRRREGLTQSAMAERLGISPSYLALIERGQRPVSARVIVQLVDRFDFDPRLLTQDGAIGGIDGLRRRLADERFADLAIDRDEMAEWLAAAPMGAAAFARLYDTGAAGAGPAGGASTDPLALARAEIERWRNHFADLDAAAEALADTLRLSSGDLGVALAERLRSHHQIAVRILPRAVMPDHNRRFDLHARQLQLSELLDPAARTFQLALQIARLEQREAVRALTGGAGLPDAGPRTLFAGHALAYFAAALLMPYGRFLRACEQTGYDLHVLERRFQVSFEQLAHRLTTLQRVGQRGLPFFMVRIDRAGQVSKRLLGASGAALVEWAERCPLWLAHRAFAHEGRLIAQTVAPADGPALGAAGEGEAAQGMGGDDGRFFCLARTVERSGAPAGTTAFAVILGCEAGLARTLAHHRGLGVDRRPDEHIGPGCAACHRRACPQRSLPPRGSALRFSEVQTGLTRYNFGDDPYR